MKYVDSFHLPSVLHRFRLAAKGSKALIPAVRAMSNKKWLFPPFNHGEVIRARSLGFNKNQPLSEVRRVKVDFS